jgi:hypothetical protein
MARQYTCRNAVEADSRHPFEVYCSSHEGYVCAHRVRIWGGEGSRTKRWVSRPRGRYYSTTIHCHNKSDAR